jgi:hypothetical protein
MASVEQPRKRKARREEWRTVRQINDHPRPSICGQCGKKLHPTSRVILTDPPADILQCKNGHETSYTREIMKRELVPKDSDSSSGSDDDDDNEPGRSFRKPSISREEVNRRKQKNQQDSQQDSESPSSSTKKTQVYLSSTRV